ncbi:FkbM family methyltransferase [Marivita sp. S2033]|uniref:FkbM family methyltransferase n=1 Tax=Marivita sp. S2033 TaxID=3373187 RepID=UPI0039825DA3
MAGTGRNTPLRRAKYALLQHVPGAIGLKYRRKLRKLVETPIAEAAFRDALARSAGTVCIDLGANLGQHTRAMAPYASRVYAFEPDPWTASHLRERLGDLQNVEVIEAAAGTQDGTLPFYRTAAFDTDREIQSQSSSLMSDKCNVDTSTAIDVSVIDFPAFLAALDTEVGVIKMDIEGAEVPLLEALFDTPVLDRVGYMFVETHESRIPALSERTDALRVRAAGMSQPVVNMDWK